MNARLLSFALLWPIALGSVEVCSAAPPAAVQFRGETASPAGESELAKHFPAYQASAVAVFERPGLSMGARSALRRVILTEMAFRTLLLGKAANWGVHG